jgi:alpha-glucosidase
MLKKYISLVCLIVFAYSSYAQSRLSQQLGSYQSHELDGQTVIITTDFGKVAISALQDEVIRVRAVKDNFIDEVSYAVIQDVRQSFVTITDATDHLMLETNKINVKINKSPVRIAFINKSGEVINQDDDLGISWIGNQVSCYKKLVADEKFVGLGEKTGPLNRRGQAYVNWNNDDYAYEVDDDPIYSSVPFYIATHGKMTYGIFLDNSFMTSFNFGASNDRFSSFSAEDGEMDYYFFGADNVRGIISDYTWLTGRMEMPPIWSLGFQQCRWSYFPDSEVLNLAQTFREKKIPGDVIYLDIHYMDAYKLFTWHPERFPEPKNMIKELNDMGFHLAVIVDPGIKKEEGYQAYESGIKNDIFIKYPDGSRYTGEVWPGWCHFPDFTVEAGRKWWGSQFEVLINAGVEGFWNDMNEPATWGNQFPDVVEFGMEGKMGTHKVAHNIYGMQMSKATKEGVDNLRDNKRSFILTRAAFAGIQRYSAVWTGDNVASDDHMLLSARMVASMGMSGMAFAGPDIGGFAGERSSELFIRWLSQGIFTPFLRNHASYNSKDHEPWAFGEDVENMSRNYLNLRYQMMPYLYSTFYEASTTGIPVARSLAIDYTFDDKIYSPLFHNQYLFGQQLLIAPTRSDQMYNKVYLPEGEWYNFWSEKKYDGKQEILVEAPLDHLPVFVKGGAIIPMQSTVQYTDQAPSDTLNIHVYEGSVGSTFEYYEDDGNTFDYIGGQYYKRKIAYTANGELVFGKVEGAWKTKFKYADIIWHSNNKKEHIDIIPFGNMSETKVLLTKTKKRK